MKILFVTARFPWPPDRGDRLTAHALLRCLSRRHEVTLLSAVDGLEPPEARRALDALGIRVETVHLSRRRSWAQAWGGLLSAVPSQVAYYRSSALEQRAAELAGESPDVVFVQLFRIAPACDGLTHPAKILFLADSLSLNLARAAEREPWWKRPMIEWERWRVDRYEVSAGRRFRESWVVSDVDREDLARRGLANVRCVPHGVDEALFDVVPARSPEPRLMFVGNLSVPHNVDAAVYAAREVLPRIRSRQSDASLWLVGADPRPEVLALAELPGVTVTGRVADLGPLWAAAHVLLAPLRFSTGIQNKVLEAMAAGVPVVTTPGAAAGVGAEGVGLMRVANDAQGLADAALRLLQDPSEAAQLAAGARAHARRHFSWDALAAEVERVAGEPGGLAGTTSRRGEGTPGV